MHSQKAVISPVDGQEETSGWGEGRLRNPWTSGKNPSASNRVLAIGGAMIIQIKEKVFPLKHSDFFNPG